MKYIEEKLILIADSHIRSGEIRDAFFCLLEKIHSMPENVSAVFLGDIFDLWIALPGYESEDQRRFLRWCEQEKERRNVIFLEGNHEFFVAGTRKQYFSAVSGKEILRNGIRLIHGDMINKADWKYRLLRFGIRNSFTRLLLRLTAFRNFGPDICWKIRHGLKHTNQAHKKFFPEAHALEYMKTHPEKKIIAGHFHEGKRLDIPGKTMYILPSFASGTEIGLYDCIRGELKTGTMEEITESEK